MVKIKNIHLYVIIYQNISTISELKDLYYKDQPRVKEKNHLNIGQAMSIF